MEDLADGEVVWMTGDEAEPEDNIESDLCGCC